MRILAFLRLRRRDAALVAVVLTLGFLGPLLMNGLNGSVDRFLAERARELQTSDLTLSSFRAVTDEEIQRLRELTAPRRESKEIELVTMLRVPAREPGQAELSQLVEIHAVDQSFPLFGHYLDKTGAKISDSRELQNEGVAWVAPEILIQMGLKTGDEILLGQGRFRIQREIVEAPGLARMGAGVAPRIYISLESLKSTGLAAFGSLSFHRVHLELSGDSEATARRIQSVRDHLISPDLFLRTPDDTSGGLERFMRFFRVFLLILTMTVLALAWFSCGPVLRSFLSGLVHQGALLISLGKSRSAAASDVLLAALIPVLSATLAAVGLVALGFQAWNWALAQNWLDLPVPLKLSLSAQDLLFSLVLALAAAVALSAPVLRLLLVRPLRELIAMNREAFAEVTESGVSVIFSAVVVMGLGLWLTGRWVDTLTVMGGLLILSGVGVGLFLLGARGLERIAPASWRLVLTQVRRRRGGPRWILGSLFVLSLVLNLGPQLAESARTELEVRDRSEMPAFFLFNIPESVVPDLVAQTTAQGAELRHLSPMILARLTSIGGAAPTDERLRRFPVRLTSRGELLRSESLVEGRFFSARSVEPSAEPELSLEARFAERNEIALGGRLEFDVQGVPLAGTVTSIRRVRWADFQPNFFINVQPGPLDDAPKTFLANVHLPEEVLASNESRARFQGEMARRFPDMSILDVGRTVERVSEIVQSSLSLVQGATTAAALVVLLILAALLQHNFSMRRRELVLQGLLGTAPERTARLWTAEYLVMSVGASILGGVAALGLVGYVSVRLLDMAFQPSLRVFFILNFLLIFLTVVTAAWTSRRVLRQPNVRSQLTSL
jgi:putative ABC transport system permease protein